MAKAYNLTTSQRVADFSGLGTLTGSNLTLMDRIVDMVTEYIERDTGQRFKKTTYTQEEYDTERAQTINLKHYPISSTDTFLLEKRTSGLNENDWETVDSEYYHVDYDTGMIYAASSTYFMRTIRGYRVTYSAGYDFNNTTTFLSDTEAGDIELATWILCTSLWNRRRGGGGIERESIGDYSVSYKRALMEDDDVRAIIDKYTVLDDAISVITPSQT